MQHFFFLWIYNYWYNPSKGFRFVKSIAPPNIEYNWTIQEVERSEFKKTHVITILIVVVNIVVVVLLVIVVA